MELGYVEQFERQEGALIPLLQRTQHEFGHLPTEALKRIAEHLGIPLTKVYGVATFYTQFRFEPVGKHTIKICHGTACHVNGAMNISQVIREEVGVNEGETTTDRLLSLERVACLGCCSLAPVIMIDNRIHGRLTTESARLIIGKVRNGESR